MKHNEDRMIEGFYKSCKVCPTETLAWAGWVRLHRPRRCQSHLAKMGRKIRKFRV